MGTGSTPSNCWRLIPIQFPHIVSFAVTPNEVEPVYIFWTYLVMNQPDLQMQYLHRKLRIQPVAGNSNFHNMKIHTKSFKIQTPNTIKKNTNWKRTKSTTFFWAIENRCRKLCQFYPPWKLGRAAANDNLFSCQFLPFVCFLFCYIFVNICLLLYFRQYLSFGSSSPQFHPWGSCQSGLSRSAACFHLYSCPLLPHKYAKYARTQIHKYADTKIPQNTRTQILLNTAFTLRCFDLLPDCPYPALLPHKLYILAIELLKRIICADFLNAVVVT